MKKYGFVGVDLLLLFCAPDADFADFPRFVGFFRFD